MEYGQVLYKNSYSLRYKGFYDVPFRYRVDPVPDVHKSKRGYFGDYYKNFRVYKRERSLYYDHKEFVRVKRSPHCLPDPWDDIQRGDIGTRKSWKNKKVRKQYLKNMPV
jgi:hypothetical protein